MMSTQTHYWLLDVASLRHQPEAWRITDISNLPAAGDVGTATEWCTWNSLLKTLLLSRCCPWRLSSAPQPSVRPWGLLISVCYLRLQAKLKCSLWRCLEVCLHKCNFRKVAWSHGHGSYTACLLSLHRTWVLLSQRQYPKHFHESGWWISEG